MEINQNFIIITAIIIGLILALYFIPFGLWLAATLSGVRISIFELILMRLRKSPVQEIVQGLIVSAKGGLNLKRDELEAIGLAGGNIENIVNGMIAAKKAGLKLSFKDASAADFKGIDILQAIKIKIEQNNDQELKFN